MDSNSSDRGSVGLMVASGYFYAASRRDEMMIWPWDEILDEVEDETDEQGDDESDD